MFLTFPYCPSIQKEAKDEAAEAQFLGYVRVHIGKGNSTITKRQDRMTVGSILKPLLKRRGFRYDEYELVIQGRAASEKERRDRERREE